MYTLYSQLKIVCIPSREAVIQDRLAKSDLELDVFQ